MSKPKKYTPSLDHITNWDNIYEPAQDSYFLMDVLEEEAEAIRELSPLVVAEVGPGTGVISAFMEWLMRTKGLAEKPQLLAIDINIEACTTTAATFAANDITPEIASIVRSDLFSAFRRDRPFIDMLVFNPPYVPSTEEEVTQDTGFSAAWAGGPRGRVVVDRFLEEAIPLMTPKTGTIYMLLISHNDPEEVVEIMNEKGCDASILKARRYGEHAFIVKIVRGD